MASPVAGALARGLYYLLPNMAIFDVKNAVVHAQPVPAGYLVTTTLYGLSYIVALVAASLLTLPLPPTRRRSRLPQAPMAAVPTTAPK